MHVNLLDTVAKKEGKSRRRKKKDENRPPTLQTIDEEGGSVIGLMSRLRTMLGTVDAGT